MVAAAQVLELAKVNTPGSSVAALRFRVAREIVSELLLFVA